MKIIFLRLEKVLLFLFLLLVPTQLGRHFWPEWSFIFGIRVDYLSPTLYLVDLVWVGLFFLNCLKPSPTAAGSPLKRAIIFILLMIVNILVARNHWAAGYKWLRLGQFIWTVWYLKENKEILKKFLFYIIPFWIVLESFLGLGQVIKGGSLNGFFYWLGERRFNFSTIGIAQMAVFGRGLVRAYGTFSHPNSLAGFLLVSLMIYKLIFNSKFLILNQIKFLKNKKDFLLWIVLGLGILGIVLTGSRTVIVFSILYLVFIMKPSPAAAGSPLKRAIFGFGCLIVLLLIFYFLIKNGVLGGWDELGLQKRIDLNMATLELIKNNLLFGVGLGNNVWPQPVHNIVLLILSEIGIIGVLIFNFQFSIFKKIKKFLLNSKNSYFGIFLIILLTGMADHYWLTLPQNIWLLVIILALAVE